MNSAPTETALHQSCRGHSWPHISPWQTQHLADTQHSLLAAGSTEAPRNRGSSCFISLPSSSLCRFMEESHSPLLSSSQTHPPEVTFAAQPSTAHLRTSQSTSWTDLRICRTRKRQSFCFRTLKRQSVVAAEVTADEAQTSLSILKLYPQFGAGRKCETRLSRQEMFGKVLKALC